MHENISLHNVLIVYVFSGALRLSGLQIIHPLLFEEGIAHSAAFFLAARFALVAAAIFCVLADGFFAFLASFFAAFGFAFFSPR
ncbi:hypothetical protein, partial [Salmonella enterica]|uniref:hypothetical protein n=1 Tax=Salmonella enterica TaxID=28901 RepID=UPI0021D4E06A